jgi:hypothetical protein
VPDPEPTRSDDEVRRLIDHGRDREAADLAIEALRRVDDEPQDG